MKDLMDKSKFVLFLVRPLFKVLNYFRGQKGERGDRGPKGEPGFVGPVNFSSHT